jgi:Flp pilus assembly protein TadD
MLDVYWFGLSAGAHHVMNVVLHALSALVLVAALHRLTGSFVRSSLVGAWFAVHPLNVENVAWVSERKTLLATLFVFVALFAYAGWVRHGGRKRMLLVCLAHALAVMAKPTAVVFPLLLLLLDFWPLRRVRGVFVVTEKIPLFAISAASSVLTFFAQRSGGAVVDTVSVPIGERLGNAAISYAWYLQKTFCPSHLSFFYPHPVTVGEHVSMKMAALATLLLIAITLLVATQIKRLPYLAVGWSWFLFALLPVIGVVQVGGQSRADRYAYLALIGIFMAVAWVLPEAPPLRLRGTVVAACASVVVLVFIAYQQCGHWRDSTTLFSYGVSEDPKNWIAWGNLGLVRLGEDRLDEAAECFRRSLAINPDNPNATFNIGYVRSLQGRHPEARQWYERTLSIRAEDVRASVALALSCLDSGDPESAFRLAVSARAVAPDNAMALYAMAVSGSSTGRPDDAASALRSLEAVSPDLARDAARRVAALRSF